MEASFKGMYPYLDSIANFVLIFYSSMQKHLNNLHSCNIQIFSLMNVAPKQFFCGREEENYEYEVLATIESR